MRARRLSEEVLVAEGPIVELDTGDIDSLKREVPQTARRRIRVCAHPDAGSPLHEMFIVHPAGTYVRPHRHVGKSESLHVLEGEAEAVFFDGEGGIRDVVPLGPYGSGRRFYYRISEPVYHSLLITSDLVFHEVTSGPFRRDETEFAPWSPDEGDHTACEAFMRRLAEHVERRT